MVHHTIYLEVKTKINGKKEGYGLRWKLGVALINWGATLLNTTVDLELREVKK